MKHIEFELLLNYLVYEMEKDGLVLTNFHFSLNEEFIESCNNFCSTHSDIEKYKEIIKQCITREYIENRTFSAFETLAITRKGQGIVYSNRSAKSKTKLQKISDYVKEHEGIPILVAALVALFSVVTYIVWGK